MFSQTEALKKYPLYKFTNQESIHNGFQFVEGLNVDTVEYTTEECSAGGIYFTYNSAFPTWIKAEHVWVWDVTIPWNAVGQIEINNKAKADRIILSNKRLIRELPEWKNIETILKLLVRRQKTITDVCELRNFKPAELLRLALFSYETLITICYALRFDWIDIGIKTALEVKYPGISLVLNKPLATQSDQERAVKLTAENIAWCLSPNEDTQMHSVKINTSNIHYIKNPSESLQQYVVNDNPYGIQHIKNPTQSIQEYCIHQDKFGYINNPSFASQILAVKLDPINITCIENPCELVQLEAIRSNYTSIEFIKNPTKGVLHYHGLLIRQLEK